MGKWCYFTLLIGTPCHSKKHGSLQKVGLRVPGKTAWIDPTFDDPKIFGEISHGSIPYPPGKEITYPLSGNAIFESR